MQHIAEVNRNSIGKILSGKRVVEPIFLKKPESPYNHVKEDDVIYFKSVDGYAIAKAKVSKVEYYSGLEPEKAMEILEKYKEEIKPDELMMAKDIYYPYATLLWLDNVQEIKPFRVLTPPETTNPRWVSVEDITKLRGV